MAPISRRGVTGGGSVRFRDIFEAVADFPLVGGPAWGPGSGRNTNASHD
jgi:hypothetical protein